MVISLLLVIDGSFDVFKVITGLLCVQTILIKLLSDHFFGMSCKLLTNNHIKNYNLFVT